MSFGVKKTPLAEDNRLTQQNRRRGRSSLKTIGSAFLIGAIVIVLSVIIGRSDNGVINVSAVIQNANLANLQAFNEGTGERLQQTNVGTRATSPNGGLRGKGDVGEERPPQPTQESAAAATSTDDGSASSTDGAVSGSDDASEKEQQDSESNTDEVVE